jgi:hypothetical protein
LVSSRELPMEVEYVRASPATPLKLCLPVPFLIYSTHFNFDQYVPVGMFGADGDALSQTQALQPRQIGQSMSVMPQFISVSVVQLVDFAHVSLVAKVGVLLTLTYPPRTPPSYSAIMMRSWRNLFLSTCNLFSKATNLLRLSSARITLPSSTLLLLLAFTQRQRRLSLTLI